MQDMSEAEISAELDALLACVGCVFLETLLDGRLEREEILIRKSIAARRPDLPVVLAHGAALRRRIVAAQRRQPRALIWVAGSLPTVRWAIGQLSGRRVPAPDDYPRCLRAQLRRALWRSSLGRLRHELTFRTLQAPVFVKPARCKAFVATRVQSAADLQGFEAVGGAAPIWCAAWVRWRSEWRAYVWRGRLLAIEHYDGDSSATLDVDLVQRCARHHYDCTGLAACALDWGVLDDGRTALVEANDAYAIGAYGQISADHYALFLLSRWQQLCIDARHS